MSHEFRICERCKKTNVKTLSKKLKEIDFHSSIVVGCQNVCGIGRNKSFAIVDHKLVIADSEDELVKKIKVIITES